MSEPRDAAINFEGVKVSMIQNKDGYMLRLAIHPNDVPDELLRSFVGSRYVVAMVEIDHNDEPKVSATQAKNNRAVASAAMLCKEQKFWDYLHSAGIIDTPLDEREVRDALCGYLGIESRSELKDNPDARDAFFTLREDFEQWQRTQS